MLSALLGAIGALGSIAGLATSILAWLQRMSDQQTGAAVQQGADAKAVLLVTRAESAAQAAAPTGKAATAAAWEQGTV